MGSGIFRPDIFRDDIFRTGQEVPPEPEPEVCPWGVQTANLMCGTSHGNTLSAAVVSNTFTRRREPTQ